VNDAIGAVIVHDESFTLGLLITLKMMDFKDAIIRISNEATQEWALEQLLQKVC
jgi:hypothetical protein